VALSARAFSPKATQSSSKEFNEMLSTLRAVAAKHLAGRQYRSHPHDGNAFGLGSVLVFGRVAQCLIGTRVARTLSLAKHNR